MRCRVSLRVSLARLLSLVLQRSGARAFGERLWSALSVVEAQLRAWMLNRVWGRSHPARSCSMGSLLKEEFKSSSM